MFFTFFTLKRELPPMIESRVLSNIPYTIHNYSNYDIVASETRDIVDVPYFPAQNLVDVSQKINPYNPDASFYFALKDSNNQERLYAFLSRTDARCLFIEFAENARYVSYQFGGDSYPQGRDNFSYTHDGENLYIFGGYADGRCMDDLWKFNLHANTWTNLNFTTVEQGVNQAPSRRRKSSVVVYPDSAWIFGGETDVLTISSEQSTMDNVAGVFIVPLNDIWSFSFTTGLWKNYDLNRVLPNRSGHIIYVDPLVIKVLVAGGINALGITEPTAIYTITIETDAVTSSSFTAPFTPSASNSCFLIDGVVNIFSAGALYKWDNTTNVFVLVYSGIATVNTLTKNYWKVATGTVNYGENPLMGSTSVAQAVMYNPSGVTIDTRSITLPPTGEGIPFINIDNVQTFYYSGIISSGGTQTFSASTYLINHTTLNVTKYEFDSLNRPQERVYPSLAYDKYHGRVYLFGGFDGTKFYNDLWYFDLGLKTWIQVHGQLENSNDTNPVYPMPRQKGGMCVVDSEDIYILGGYSDIHAFNDFWKYNITTGAWNRIYLVDDIPWGSQYFIFEWSDVLWMYNGQQLYKYFAEILQFVVQPFLIANKSTMSDSSGCSSTSAIDGEGGGGTSSTSTTTSEIDPLSQLITSLEYLNVPIRCTVVNGHMVVQNSDFLFDVDLNSKVVTNYKEKFGVTETVQWLDSYWGIGLGTLAAYFINISSLISLTKNQIPYSYFYKQICSPLSDGVFYTDYGNFGGAGGSTLHYQDNQGMFTLQGSTLPINKGELYVDGNASFVGKASEFPTFNFDDVNAVADQTITILAEPTTYTFTPWFLYDKYKPVGSFYEGAQRVVYNHTGKRIYVIYKNGNTVKINPEDNTFFTYYTHIWEGSAIGYYEAKNKIFAFGGLRGNLMIYMQSGLSSIPIVIPNPNNKLVEQTHGGLMEFDLNMNDMNLGSVASYQREHDVASVDYSITKSYLTSLISSYLEGYSNNVIPDSLDEIKQKIYLATQPLVDDLSQFNYAFENGERMISRSYTANCQVGNKLYIFGGCECWTMSCTINQTQTPYNVGKPGGLANQVAGNQIYDVDVESKRAKVFDMEDVTWYDLAPLPEWKYMAACIPSEDGRYIYIVGGYTGSIGGSNNCDGKTCAPSKDILIYDIQTNSYEKLQGIPTNYRGRANPLLRWLDSDRLFIMYGFYTYNKSSGGGADCIMKTYYHMPIGDAWIYDKRQNLMYRAFEDILGYVGIVAKDTFYVDSVTSVPNSLYILAATPSYKSLTSMDPIMKAYQWDLITGDVTVIPIIPTTEIINDFNAFESMDGPSQVDSACAAANLTTSTNLSLEDIALSVYTNSNFRFRYAWMETYGEYDHSYMFIIGERSDDPGIKFLEEIARGNKEAQLRFWYVDIEAPDSSRFLWNVTYEYPLPISPVALAYDGSRYIYCVYNKYNIWRLDFKNVLADPSGTWWYRLPPCIDCNFLGDSRTDTVWDTYFIQPSYLVLQSSDGKFARMDVNTFVWFLDKRIAPESPVVSPAGKNVIDSKLMSATGVDNNETYLYQLGGISGKVMNVFERQWDNFFFDMTVTADVVQYFKSALSQKLWPTVIRRKRLYTINHLGHVFYSWLRIDGQYDVEFQLNDFYQGDELRIYGDDLFLQNWENVAVSVFDIHSGWVVLAQNHYTVVVNETGWSWDSAYMRRYVRQVVDPFGDLVYQYSTQPNNYLAVDIPGALGVSRPISKVRVTYKNTPAPYNYISRINKVELITYQTTLASYDMSSAVTPLSIIHIDPLVANESYSNEFAVYVKNSGDQTVKDVYVYAYGNNWLQFTLTPDFPNTWTIRTEKTPFLLANEILPGNETLFYIRAVNIDQLPHIEDLVLKGIYPYSGS